MRERERGRKAIRGTGNRLFLLEEASKVGEQLPLFVYLFFKQESHLCVSWDSLEVITTADAVTGHAIFVSPKRT